MPIHPTRLSNRDDSTGEWELTTQDRGVAHKAGQAGLTGAIESFVYWTGDAEEVVEGRVTSYQGDPPFRFTVKPKSEEVASADVSAAGPQDRTVTKATEGSGMLPKPGGASDNDMAPSG